MLVFYPTLALVAALLYNSESEIKSDLTKNPLVVLDELFGCQRRATDDIANWFGYFAGEATVGRNLPGSALMGNQPIRHAAPLHRLLGLVECYRDINNLAAKDLREHVRKFAEIAPRSGKFEDLADVRCGIKQNARSHSAGIAYVDEGERQIGGEGQPILPSFLIEAACANVFCMKKPGRKDNTTSA